MEDGEKYCLLESAGNPLPDVVPPGRWHKCVCSCKLVRRHTCPDSTSCKLGELEKGMRGTGSVYDGRAGGGLEQWNELAGQG